MSYPFGDCRPSGPHREQLQAIPQCAHGKTDSNPIIPSALRGVSRVERLFRLASILESGVAPRSSEIAGKLGISLRTLYRDMAEIRKLGSNRVSMRGIGDTESVTVFDQIALYLSTDEALAFVAFGDKTASDVHSSKTPLSRAIIKITEILRREIPPVSVALHT